MADRNAQPSSTSAPDAESSTPKQESKDEPQFQQTSADSLQTGTSQVRNSVLEAIANHQKERISELERNLEKKRATIQRLCAASPLPHSAFPIVPPAAIPAMRAIPTNAPVPSAPSNSTPLNQTPTSVASEGASTNPRPSSHPAPSSSQPQPAKSAAASNPVMPAPMLGFPPQPHLPPYPYIYPPPDPSFAAQYMGAMPPPILHPTQPSHPQPSGHVHQQEKGNDGQEQKQSRYWTPDEHERFLAGMKACGPKNYLQISEFVGTRNAKQVRTHAQKYQKRLEREDAKRRSDMRHGRINNSGAVTSVAADAAAAVKAAAAAAMRGKVPGISTAQGKDSDSTDTPAGPSSSSSGKQCQSSHQHSQGASSAEGSISANTATERHGETSGTHNHSAAMAAIAAEAKALGRGVLPSVAIKIPSHAFSSTPQPTMVNKDTGNVEDKKSSKASGAIQGAQPALKQGSSEKSAPSVQKCIDRKEVKQDGDRSDEVAEMADTKGEEFPAVGDNTKEGKQKECTETIVQSKKNQNPGEEVCASHMAKVKDVQIKTEQLVDNNSESCQDEQLSGRAKVAKEQSVEMEDSSVVHTRLTKTVAGQVSAEAGTSGMVDGATTVKHEAEYVDSCTNLTDGRKADGDAAAGRGAGEGEGRETEKVKAVKQEAHMAGVVETDEGERKSGDGETRSVSGDAYGRRHGAGDESDHEEGQHEAAGKQTSTALNADSKRDESAAESRKRTRDEEETAGNKRAKTGDGCERKQPTAADGGDGGGGQGWQQSNGGNRAAAS